MKRRQFSTAPKLRPFSLPVRALQVSGVALLCVATLNLIFIRQQTGLLMNLVLILLGLFQLWLSFRLWKYFRQKALARRAALARMPQPFSSSWAIQQY